jgi:REP element-mobilizing transposase RayT
VFITFTTDRRWELPETAREIVLKCCLGESERKVALHAAVVMPDHAHMILTALQREDGGRHSLPEIMHSVKGISARRINKLLHRSGPVWQKEFFDHVLRSSDSLAEKINYVCHNPVRAGLVSTENEYRWLWRGEIPTL